MAIPSIKWLLLTKTDGDRILVNRNRVIWIDEHRGKVHIQPNYGPHIALQGTFDEVCAQLGYSAPTDPAEQVYRASMDRLGWLMGIGPASGTEDAQELIELAKACEAYEKKRWPMGGKS